MIIYKRRVLAIGRLRPSALGGENYQNKSDDNSNHESVTTATPDQPASLSDQL